MRAADVGIYPIALENSTGTQVTFITDTGELWCQGVHSSLLAYAATLPVGHDNATIDSFGNIVGASIIVNGDNGISVYSGTIKTTQEILHLLHLQQTQLL